MVQSTARASRTYVDQVLGPNAEAGRRQSSSIISVATRARRCAAPSGASGARLLFLPPYSPDLNPIEQVFAKLKHLYAKGQGANRPRRYLETHRLIARNLQIQRMQKLLHQCRLRFILK